MTKHKDTFYLYLYTFDGRPDVLMIRGGPTHHQYVFAAFQTLPVLVVETLVWGIGTKRNTGKCDQIDLADHLLSRYDENQVLSIGFLLIEMDLFLDKLHSIDLLNCYVDNQCDMVLTKLAWSEDY